MRPWRPFLTLTLTVAALAVACGPPRKEEKPDAPTPTAIVAPTATASATAASSADAPGTYMGRRIAPTMSHVGAAWLVRPEREREESASRMLSELKLRPGDVACDVGAGNGYHTLEMAKAVAPKGRAIAVDIQPEMLTLLLERAKAAGIANVETVLGEGNDPKLPPATCDVVLLADVYHELDDPGAMLANLKRALSPKGLLVLLEFRAEDPKVPILAEHKMSREQILRELEANGYALARSFDELPWQHLVFFRPSAR